MSLGPGNRTVQNHEPRGCFLGFHLDVVSQSTNGTILFSLVHRSEIRCKSDSLSLHGRQWSMEAGGKSWIWVQQLGRREMSLRWRCLQSPLQWFVWNGLSTQLWRVSERPPGEAAVSPVFKFSSCVHLTQECSNCSVIYGNRLTFRRATPAGPTHHRRSVMGGSQTPLPFPTGQVRKQIPPELPPTWALHVTHTSLG